MTRFDYMLALNWRGVLANGLEGGTRDGTERRLAVAWERKVLALRYGLTGGESVELHCALAIGKADFWPYQGASLRRLLAGYAGGYTG